MPSGDEADEQPVAPSPPDARPAAGNRRVVKPSRCSWPGCKDGFNVARQRGYTFCGKKGGVGGARDRLHRQGQAPGARGGQKAREGAMERVPQAARGHGGAPGALGTGMRCRGFFRLVIRVTGAPKRSCSLPYINTRTSKARRACALRVRLRCTFGRPRVCD